MVLAHDWQITSETCFPLGLVYINYSNILIFNVLPIFSPNQIAVFFWKFEFLFTKDSQYTGVWKYCGVYKILCCLINVLLTIPINSTHFNHQHSSFSLRVQADHLTITCYGMTIDSRQMNYKCWPISCAIHTYDVLEVSPYQHLPTMLIWSLSVPGTISWRKNMTGIYLAFDFCRFCVVIRFFFHPRHNGQWPQDFKGFLSQILTITFLSYFNDRYNTYLVIISLTQSSILSYYSRTIFYFIIRHIHIYRILHELSFNINIYGMRLRHVTKWAHGKFCYVRGTSFIKNYIKMTASVSFF